MKFNTLRTVFRREEIRGELKTTSPALCCWRKSSRTCVSSGMKLLYCNIFPIYLAIKRNKLFRYTQILWFQIFGLWVIASECILTKVLDRWSWSIIDTWCRRLARYITLAQLNVRKVRNYELWKPSKKKDQKTFLIV